MSYEIFLFIALIAILLLGFGLHIAYLERIKSKVMKTADSAFETKDLKKALQIAQGSNFNTIILSTWSLFFVTLTFLYFLTPSIFPHWNYFELPRIASSDFGLMILGIVVILVTGILAFNIPKVYRYYEISKWTKECVIYITPILLLVSLFSSIYIGTIYPDVDYNYWNLAYLTLIISIILLIVPIFSGFLEGFK